MARKYSLEDSLEFRSLKKYAESITSHNKDADLEEILREYSRDLERYERTAPKSPPQFEEKSGEDECDAKVAQDTAPKEEASPAPGDSPVQKSGGDDTLSSLSDEDGADFRGESEKAHLLDLAFGAAEKPEPEPEPEVLPDYIETLSQNKGKAALDADTSEFMGLGVGTVASLDEVGDENEDEVISSGRLSDDDDDDEDDYEDLGFFARRRKAKEEKRLLKALLQEEREAQTKKAPEAQQSAADSAKSGAADSTASDSMGDTQKIPIGAGLLGNIQDRQMSREEEIAEVFGATMKDAPRKQDSPLYDDGDEDEDGGGLSYRNYSGEDFDPADAIIDADEYDEVYDELALQSSRSAVRLIVSAIISVILIGISAFEFFGATAPGILSVNGPKVYATIQLVLFVVLIIMNAKVLGYGAKTLFSAGNQRAESVVLLSTAIIFAHTVYQFVMCVMFDTGFYSYVSAVSIAMLFYAAGRKIYDSTHLKNFETIYDAASNISEVRRADDPELAPIARKFAPGGEYFYYKESVGSTGGFLEHARGGEKSGALGPKISITVIAVALVLSAALVIMQGVDSGLGGILMIVTSMFAMAMPAMFELTGSLVFSKSARAALRSGAVVAGAGCARRNEDITAILLKDTDLFKKGSVIISGMKVLDPGLINNLIPDLASIFVTIDSPAKYAFLDIIDNKMKLLKPVSFFELIEEDGLLALIDSQKLLLGSREFMMRQGVIKKDDKSKYFRQGKARSNLYVAQNGRLVCVLSIGILLDREVAHSLLSLEGEDAKAVVMTYDPSFTKSSLRRRFLMSADGLELMQPDDMAKFGEAAQKRDKIGRSGLYLTEKNATAFCALVSAVKGIAMFTRTNRTIMVAAMFAAPVLLSLIALLNGITQITPFSIVLFHALWSIPVFVNSAFTK